jgi:hypothetical protein
MGARRSRLQNRRRLASESISPRGSRTLRPALVYWRSRGAQKLTEKDSILLADFVNTTGDPVFDGTLKQALAVQLEQSPYLNIVPDQTVRKALQFMAPGR